MLLVQSLNLVCFYLVLRTIRSSPDVRKDSLPQTITGILNKLTNTTEYDKRLRPKYGGPPVDVGITIHVSSISAVSEVQMDYTLDIYLRQMWTDERLSFDELGVKRDLTIGVEYMKSIWVPDTFFPNEKNSFFHLATTHNSFLRISPEGKVLTSQRLTVTATCNMELHLFPLDSQECTLEIESYGYSTLDIRYRWEKGKKSVGLSDSARVLPQFTVTSFDIQEKEAALSTGNYSRLECTFVFTRSLGFYLIQIYLPAMLIVIISWVSFWLSRDATPARVSLGVTTVLTMTTLITTTNAAMPKVSYIKSIDVYLITCFFMVFSALLEYAAVCYLNKRLKMRKEHAAKAQKPASTATAPGPVPVPPTLPPCNPMGSAVSVYTPVGGSPIPLRYPMNTHAPMGRSTALSGNMDGKTAYGAFTGSTAHQYSGHSPGQYSVGNSPLLLNPAVPGRYQELECDCDIERRSVLKKIRITAPTKRNRSCTFMPSPSGIDKYSRMIFPFMFAIFNALYWIISKKEDNYKASVTKSDSVLLPQFVVEDYHVNQKIEALATGNYSRLICKFIFVRNLGFYIIQIYLPSILIVVISWVSFWLNRDATPARVSLGVTTVLTMTTIITTTNNAMPKVSYIKSIDIYLVVCFVMVFAALLEYAAVCYLNKRLKMHKEQKPVTSGPSRAGGTPNLAQGNNNPPAIPARFPPVPNPNTQAIVRTVPATGEFSMSGATTTVARPSHMPFATAMPHVECDCDLGSRMTAAVTLRPAILQTRTKVRNRGVGGITPSAIDKYSRLVFPILFLLFNVMYWCISEHLSAVRRQQYIDASRQGAMDPLRDDCFMPRNDSSVTN